MKSYDQLKNRLALGYNNAGMYVTSVRIICEEDIYLWRSTDMQ